MPVLAGNAFGVFVDKNLHNLRVTLDESRPGGMKVQFTKLAAQRLLVLRRQCLIAEEQHAVLGESVSEHASCTLVKCLRQVDTEHFGTTMRSQFPQLRSLRCHSMVVEQAANTVGPKRRLVDTIDVSIGNRHSALCTMQIKPRSPSEREP